MPDATGTLDLIDGAIRDWETSPDAMRWGPDGHSKRGREVSAVWIDEAFNNGALDDWLRQMHEALVRPLAMVAENFAATFRAMAAALQPLIAAEAAHSEDAEQRPSWHKRRCAACNPACYTPPCPGGAEYHRRLRARARRRRK